MRSLRALFATLVIVCGLALSLLAPPPAAHADEPESLVTIRLDSFTPSLPQRKSVITVTGQVTNTSKKRLLRPRAYFWRNQAPITDSEGFDQALESASNDPIGARKIASFDNLFTHDNPYLDAGASVGFTLKVRVSDLELSPTSGIYLMGVHVLQNEETPAVGRARVFVPILSEAPRNTLQMTTVVALNSRPSLVRKGVFSDDHLAAEIAPGGRLDALLRAADQDSVSFAIDPALVEELQTMRGGYQVQSGEGTVAGTGAGNAARWLDAFARVSTTRDGYRLLYGSVDVAAMAHAGRRDVLVGSEAAAKTVASTAQLPLLVWPGAGAADDATVTAAASLRPAAILLSDSSTRAGAPLLQGLPAGGARGPAIVNYTSTAFSGGPGPDPSDTPVHLQQRMLAQWWLQATTEPAGTTLGQVRVINSTAQAEGEDQAVQAPWIQPATLSQLLRSTPAAWDKTLRYTEDDRAKELGASQLAALDQLSSSWATWQELLVNPTAAKASADAALARVASVRERGVEEPFQQLVDPQQRELELALEQVQISVTRRIQTPKSKPDSGVYFPITIRNRLPQPDAATSDLNTVKVKLHFVSDNSQRLTVRPLGLTSIPAGQNFTGRAVVEARSNGTVRVTAQLSTASGRPIGRPATIDVTATQSGTVGWLIALGAGIVLVGTTALRIRQVSRERVRAAAAAGGGTEPLDATRSAPPQDIDPQHDASTQPGQNTSESIDV